ncbi:Phenol hydroxylase P5 protein [Methylocella tundrae]|uniref:Phenol hydroxylase P5 protein n=1 Tax=Methylocella tundrae TaxID=227605 RepID=A0A8B6M7S7_METTU|nr:2Fe-2S iron-sulfur cluster binding domain-containing protein [Methylocella tundrae]VTZ28375.1 Phenol hydroxylase P5 protein [Methylocella tundrae]VTZ50808.1 Phenol hydroxylase P5 protein [Methylocella tundrae]
MTYQLTIEPLGETIAVEDGQTMLDACLRAGVWLPHACGHGLCGTCKVEVLEGQVTHNEASSFALMDFERDEGKALACTATLDADTIIEAEIDNDPDARRIPIRDFKGVIERAKMLAEDVLGLWLNVPGEGVAFQAGQYLAVSAPGVEGPRSFSIASPPSQPNCIELHIRIVPGGKATTWLRQNAAPGMPLDFAGPYGRFYVRHSVALPRLFLAGGSGLSSPQSMILDLLERGETQPITLVHGARSADGLYHSALFRELAERHGNFRYIPAVSGETDGWKGETGFVHEVIHRVYNGRFDGNQAYLCGPAPMIDACITTLMRGRLFEQHIFTEKFLTPADAEKARSPLFRKI